MDISIKPKIYVSTLITQTKPAESFDIIRYSGLPCAYCGKKMLTSNFISKTFNTDAETNTEMLERAIKLKQSLPLYKQEILDILNQTKIQNKLTSDTQILKKASEKSSAHIKKEVFKRFEEIKNIIDNSNDTRLKTLISRNGKKYKELLLKNPNYMELVKLVKNCFYNGYSGITNNETRTKIEEKISDIKSGKDTYEKDYTLKRIIYRYPRQFYMYLFNHSIATVDHVVPKSAGGPDTRDNFLSVCRDCNEKKSNLPLSLFMIKSPKIKTNIINQLKILKASIPQMVLQGKLDINYLDYYDNISRNLAKITKAEINITA